MSVLRQSGRQLRDLALVAGLVVCAVVVGGYIVAHQRLELPGWVPFAGTHGYVISAEFQTAQGVMPGQGQAVTVAGVAVGTVQRVDLHEGRAVIRMRIDPGAGVTVHRDATMLLRPKTGLKDMAVALDPGHRSSPPLPSGSTLGVAQTAPDVNLDEFLSGLDAGTQDYLRLLLAGAGTGLRGNAGTLSSVLRRFDPTARDLAQISVLLQRRRRSIRHAVHDFRRFVEAVGAKDGELSRFVDASAAVLRTFAAEDRSLRATLHELPGALEHTATAMGRVTRLTQVAGPALRHLRPTATHLGPGLRATVPVLRDTPRVITRRLDPFAAAAVPTLDELVPAARDLRPLTASLSGAFGVFDRFLNALAYNPSRTRAGFLLYGAWASHNLNSVLSAQDASGPMGRTLLLQDCDSRALLSAAAKTNPAVRLLLGLWDPPTQRQIGGCGAAASRLTRTPAARR